MCFEWKLSLWMAASLQFSEKIILGRHRRWQLIWSHFFEIGLRFSFLLLQFRHLMILFFFLCFLMFSHLLSGPHLISFRNAKPTWESTRCPPSTLPPSRHARMNCPGSSRQILFSASVVGFWTDYNPSSYLNNISLRLLLRVCCTSWPSKGVKGRVLLLKFCSSFASMRQIVPCGCWVCPSEKWERIRVRLR